MKTARNFFKVSLVFGIVASYSAIVFACGGTKVTSMSQLSNGNVEIVFSQDNFGKQEKLTLDDDDGIATITTLHYLNIHDLALSDGMWKKWDTLRNQNVPAWPKMRGVILSQLDRVAASYKKVADQTDNADTKSRANLAAEEAIKTKNALDKPTLTYDEYNVLGKYLDQEAKMHAYHVAEPSGDQYRELIENNTNNPIGSAFGDVPFALPPQFTSECASPFEGDIASLAASIGGKSNGAGAAGSGTR